MVVIKVIFFFCTTTRKFMRSLKRHTDTKQTAYDEASDEFYFITTQMCIVLFRMIIERKPANIKPQEVRVGCVFV